MLSAQKSEGSKTPRKRDPWTWGDHGRLQWGSEVDFSLWLLSRDWIWQKDVPDESRGRNALYVIGIIKGTASQCGALCTLEKTPLGGSVVSYFYLNHTLKNNKVIWLVVRGGKKLSDY